MREANTSIEFTFDVLVCSSWNRDGGIPDPFLHQSLNLSRSTQLEYIIKTSYVKAQKIRVSLSTPNITYLLLWYENELCPCFLTS